MKLFLPLALTLPILLSACGGDNSSSANSSQLENSSVTTPATKQEVGKDLRMNLDLAKLQSAGVTADRIVVSITKDDFTKTIEVEHADYSATAEFSNLVLGEYQITVEIFDGETLVAGGVGTGTVSANQLATIDLRLELMSGGLAVNVCVPSLDDENLFSYELNMVIVEKAELIGLATGILAELTAGGSLIYGTTLKYDQLAVDQDIQVTLGLLDNFETIDESTKTVEADENTMIINSNGESVLTATSCNQKYTLKMVDATLDDLSFFGAGKRIQLITEVVVDAIDYIQIDGGEILDIDGGTSGHPYYRQINKVVARIKFQPIQGGIGTITAFENANASELFDTANFSHSIELEAYSNEGGFPIFTYPAGEVAIPVLGLKSFKAEAQMLQ